MSELIWPLQTHEYPIPQGNDPGAFGVQRRGYIHSGVDLYCEPGTEVYAMEDGVVVSVEDFTGSKNGSPWWNDTQGILIKGETGVICYGEVDPLVKIGDEVKQGQMIAKVLTVMKKYKGNPMTMLHFELYNHETKTAAEWIKKEERPDNLLDPTPMLLKL